MDSVTGYIRLQNYNLGGSIADFTVGQYVRIDNEYCKIIQVFASDNAILVTRGLNGTTQESYSSGTVLTRTAQVQVFDSSVFQLGDIVQINSEKFKIVNIDIFKAVSYTHLRAHET